MWYDLFVETSLASQFWRNSSLRISPLEEVEFLGKLIDETLPFDKDVMRAVKRMILMEESGDHTLYGKSRRAANEQNRPFISHRFGAAKQRSDTGRRFGGPI
ncbi:hypothetical protein [Paenibacillus sp. FJAT-27812]|jgi:beta-lactamase class D|uniref:hypothetical protein n=1 Tax=Paenibacillus sp. FJAT-27812 TaxID=1684143 RepID=UPI001146E253